MTSSKNKKTSSSTKAIVVPSSSKGAQAQQTVTSAELSTTLDFSINKNDIVEMFAVELEQKLETELAAAESAQKALEAAIEHDARESLKDNELFNTIMNMQKAGAETNTYFRIHDYYDYDRRAANKSLMSSLTIEVDANLTRLSVVFKTISPHSEKMKDLKEKINVLRNQLSNIPKEVKKLKAGLVRKQLDSSDSGKALLAQFQAFQKSLQSANKQ